jgi:SAM-dependent methyltransferase
MSTTMTQAETAPHPLHLLLPRLGTEAEFSALRALFRRCGFDGEGICRRLEIPSILEFKAKCDGRTNAITFEEPVDPLIRLFLDGEFVSESTLDSVAGPGTTATLESLAIVTRDETRAGVVFATITLYPAEGTLLLAGDRPGMPDGSKYWLPPDVVYPGILENTRHFLQILPQTPCDALLDLGTGSGVAALAASRYARHVWGSDVAARSVRFSEFNRRLNDISNAAMVEGDLYQAVAGLTFDRIVSHPPYVPAPRTELIFRDGGDDGEQILRRIVEGLPLHLRTDGRFYTLVLGADLEDETFEARIRRWLGPNDAEFDLVMVSHSLRTPAEFVANSLKSGKVRLRDLKFWTDTWARRKTQFLFYGSVLIRRHASARQPVTARVQRGAGFQASHQDWLLDWETECRQPGATEFLLNSHPSMAPAAELHVLHRLSEGRFVPEMFGIEIKEPFVTDLRCSQWMVALIAACDGEKTWGELLDRGRENGIFHTEIPNDELAEVLRTLVAQGILRIRERPL